MIVDLRCPQCNRTIDASKQEVVTCGQQVVDQVYMKHQWCARCDVAIRGVVQSVAWEGGRDTYVVTFTNKATVCTRLPLE